MIYRSHDTETHYCRDLTCPGASGFEVKWHPATMIDPAWPDTDTCPHCGHEMTDQRLTFAEPLDALLTALDDADVPMPSLCDEDELLRVIAVELKRQLTAERKPRTATPAINREFPPHMTPAWLKQGATR